MAIPPYLQCAAVTSPAGAAATTVGVHTYVPAVTTANDPGSPRVTSCSGSRSGIDRTVYCQEPAHSGPVKAVGVDPAGRTSRSRRSAATIWARVGRPAHGEATVPAGSVGTGGRSGSSPSSPLSLAGPAVPLFLSDVDGGLSGAGGPPPADGAAVRS